LKKQSLTFTLYAMKSVFMFSLIVLAIIANESTADEASLNESTTDEASLNESGANETKLFLIVPPKPAKPAKPPKPVKLKKPTKPPKVYPIIYGNAKPAKIDSEESYMTYYQTDYPISGKKGKATKGVFQGGKKGHGKKNPQMLAPNPQSTPTPKIIKFPIFNIFKPKN